MNKTIRKKKSKMLQIQRSKDKKHDNMSPQLQKTKTFLIGLLIATSAEVFILLKSGKVGEAITFTIGAFFITSILFFASKLLLED